MYTQREKVLLCATGQINKDNEKKKTYPLIFFLEFQEFISCIKIVFFHIQLVPESHFHRCRNRFISCYPH